MSQISYDKTAKLFLIPTPIGNLEDITLRAINTLKQVDVVFCEDTRVTGLLMKHLGISKKLVANHEFNEKENNEKLLSYLEQGIDVGLVSDRGTPVISDPGFGMAKCAMDNGYNVIGLPGPTALISALVTSGLSPRPFLFYGFLNSKSSKRIKELEEISSLSSTLIFYESPHRVIKTFEDMYKVFGNRNISISREISKKFEEVIRTDLETILKENPEFKGEMVIVVSGNNEEIDYSDISILEHVNLYIKEGISSKDAIKKVALDRNMKKSDIYNIYHRGE